MGVAVVRGHAASCVTKIKVARESFPTLLQKRYDAIIHRGQIDNGNHSSFIRKMFPYGFYLFQFSLP